MLFHMCSAWVGHLVVKAIDVVRNINQLCVGGAFGWGPNPCQEENSDQQKYEILFTKDTP